VCSDSLHLDGRRYEYILWTIDSFRCAGQSVYTGVLGRVYTNVLGRVYTVIVRECTCMHSDSLHHDEHFVRCTRIAVCRVESRDTFCAYVYVCILTPYIVMDIL